MSQFSSHDLRTWLRSNYCDQLLFGCAVILSSIDLFNARYGSLDTFSTEFCTAIHSILNHTAPMECERIDYCDSISENGVTYDWDVSTQDFSILAYGNKDVAVEVVRPLTTKTTAQKWLKKAKIKEYCVFCRNNNEPEYVYKSHPTRDVFNRILCSRLRAYVCPICGESGDNAHTIKYCPKKPILTMDKIQESNSRKRLN